MLEDKQESGKIVKDIKNDVSVVTLHGVISVLDITFELNKSAIIISIVLNVTVKVLEG